MFTTNIYFSLACLDVYFFHLFVQDHRVEQFVLSPLHNVLVISYEMLLRCLEQVQYVHLLFQELSVLVNVTNQTCFVFVFRYRKWSLVS